MVFVDSFLRMDFICFTQQVRRREEGGRRLVWEGGGMVGVAGVMPLVITTVRFKSLVKFFFFLPQCNVVRDWPTCDTACLHCRCCD